MFSPAGDTPHVWIATALAATALAGLVLQVPATAPSRATALVETIDSVAGSPYPTVAKHPVDAASLRVEQRTISLRTPAGVSHATVGYPPLTPVLGGEGLAQVLRGTTPSAVFQSPERFAAAIDAAQEEPPAWQGVEGPVIIRRVSWEGVDVTLIGS